MKIEHKLSNPLVQKGKQKQKMGQKGRGDGKDKPPSRHLWVKRHGPKCSCPDCRRYYIVEDGEVKKKSKRIIPLDREKTLDTYEYIKSKKINKFKHAKRYSNDAIED